MLAVQQTTYLNDVELTVARVIIFKMLLDGVNHSADSTLPFDSSSSLLCHGNLLLSWGSTQQESALKQDGSRRGPLGLRCSTAPLAASCLWKALSSICRRVC